VRVGKENDSTLLAGARPPGSSRRAGSVRILYWKPDKWGRFSRRLRVERRQIPVLGITVDGLIPPVRDGMHEEEAMLG